jgi:hypothetical protein
MNIEVWFIIGAGLITVELFLQTNTLSRCLTLLTVMRRAQRAIRRRSATESRKERAVTGLWLLTMKHTLTLALNILAVFMPVALLWVVDIYSNMRIFALLNWGSQHLILIFATVAYALARRSRGR